MGIDFNVPDKDRFKKILNRIYNRKTGMTGNDRILLKELKAELVPERIALLKERIETYENEIENLLLRYENMRKTNSSYFERQIFLKPIDKFRKLIRKYQNEIDFRESKNENELMTDEQIETARQHPIGNLVELKRNRAKCPLHNGDNRLSFSVKDNKFYCFSCNTKGDVIDLYMKLNGCSFREAVKLLTNK